MKTLGIIQCRLGSSRLPAKAALDLHGKPLLARVIERCRLAQGLDEIVVATSDQLEDTIVKDIAKRAGALVFEGPLHDVRQRLLSCAHHHKAQTIIRLTADNPYTEPSFIDELIDTKTQYPDCAYAVHDLAEVVYGTASELIDVAVLQALQSELPDGGREHVTTGLASLGSAQILKPADRLADPDLSLTIDTLAQYRAIWQLMAEFGSGPDALPQIISAFHDDPSPPSHFPTRDP